MDELRNTDNFGVVEVVDRPQSQQVLLTRWVSKQRLDGSCKVRLVARGFEQKASSDTDFYAGTPKLTTLRALLTIAAIHGTIAAIHGNDVVGTGPEEHLMIDFEYKKTSLH